MVKVSVLCDLIYGIECHPKHKKTAVNKKNTLPQLRRDSILGPTALQFNTLTFLTITLTRYLILVQAHILLKTFLYGAVSQRCRPMTSLTLLQILSPLNSSLTGEGT